MSVLLAASLEVAMDPLAAWEQALGIVFGIGIPSLALEQALVLHGRLANPNYASALAVRHGANRRRSLIEGMGGSLAVACFLLCVALVGCRIISHTTGQSVLDRDLLRCCGIGCLATTAYIAWLLASTRLGVGKVGAWLAFGLDLTLGHIRSGWLVFLPHPSVANLLGYPGLFLMSAWASSWVLVGLALVGVSVTLIKTPR